MKVIATIQARMNSSRLPGKVLASIEGKPMLMWQIERLRNCGLIDEIVVATTQSPSDDALTDLCLMNDVQVFRGSEADVLGRVSKACKSQNADIHVECFGDSPLVDPRLIEGLIGHILKYSPKLDCVTTTRQTSFPPGMDVMVYTSNSLYKVDDEVTSNDPLREHAGYNITRFPEVFEIHDISAPSWLNFPDVFLTVDYPEDLNLIRKVASQLGASMSWAPMESIIEVANKNPQLLAKNSKLHRPWKKLRNES